MTEEMTRNDPPTTATDAAATAAGHVPARQAPFLRAPEGVRTVFTVTLAAACAPLAAGIVLFIFLKKQAGRRTLDWLRLNVPLLSTMYKQLYITRAMRTMSTLIEGGVDLLDSIEITRGVTNNYYYERFWNGVVVYVKQGRQFSDVFRNSNLFSPMIAQMVDAGERSGQLANVMDKVAVSCEEDLDEAVKKMTQYIEPLMISFMGILVGSVAIALLLPIFSIGTVMSQ